jgi:hypothetical protein
MKKKITKKIPRKPKIDDDIPMVQRVAIYGRMRTAEQ